MKARLGFTIKASLLSIAACMIVGPTIALVAQTAKDGNQTAKDGKSSCEQQACQQRKACRGNSCCSNNALPFQILKFFEGAEAQ